MPFWDWARKDVTIFPKDALNNETRVPGPSSTASVNPEYNPLFQSPFQDGVPEDISFVSGTARYFPYDAKVYLNPYSRCISYYLFSRYTKYF